jgi:hypothetical protein
MFDATRLASSFLESPATTPPCPVRCDKSRRRVRARRRGALVCASCCPTLSIVRSTTSHRDPRAGLARGDQTAWLRMQSDANSSLHQPANREINREFCPIRPFTAIFVSDQRADSMAYSGIPYVTEQGISKDVSGKILSRNRESGNLRICIPASPHFLNEKLVWASLRSCGCQTTRMRRRSMNSAKTLTWKATSRRYESPIWGSRVKPTLAMGLILCCSCSRRSTSPVASWVAPQGLHSSANPLPNSAGYAIFGWQREIRHHG